ncbi:MAG: hypothetical protein ABIL62_12110, partial [Planctomycetota bacterium]
MRLHTGFTSGPSLVSGAFLPIMYRGTVTGLRISAVDGGATESGGAFVDALPSAVTDLIAAYPGDLSFEAFDPAGRFIRGVLKAVGSGETLGSELITNPNFVD